MKKQLLWEGQNIHGERLQGIDKRQSASELINELSNKNIFRLKVVSVSGFSTREFTDQELVQLFESWIMLTKAGFTFLEALNHQLKEEKRSFFKYILTRLKTQIEKGESIQSSFEKLHKNFPNLVINIVRISEKTGDLASSFSELKRHYNEKLERTKKIKKVTQYPKIVFLISLMIFWVILVFIVPLFKNIYLLAGENLPLLTKILVESSDFLNQNLLEFLILISLAVIFRKKLTRFFPQISRIFNRSSLFVEHYTQSISLMLYNGIHLYKAHEILLADSDQHHQILRKLLLQLNAGEKLSNIYEQLNFPEILISLIKKFEKIGKLADGFKNAHLLFVEQREQNFDRISKYIEPILLIFISSFVLMVVLGIYLPLFEVNDYLSK